MESKSLHAIQVIAKIGKILSRIIFVFSLIGAIGCAAGAISFAVMGSEPIQVGRVTVYGLVQSVSGESDKVIFVRMLIAMVACIGECVLCKYAIRYFKNELKAGTPFTFEGAKQMRKLGIASIVVPIVTSVICASINAALYNFTEAGFNENLSIEANIGMGLLFIFMSVIFKYGAELQEKAEAK